MFNLKQGKKGEKKEDRLGSINRKHIIRWKI